MTRRLRSLLSLFAALFWACGDAVGPGEPITGLPRELSVAEGKLIEADNRFAFKLFREIAAQEDPDANIFISPLSVAMVLGMTYNGAAGETRDAMAATLELEGMTIDEVNEAYRGVITLLRDLDPQVEWLLGNSIWHRDDFTPLPGFLDVTSTFFDAEVAGLDFASRSASETINAWVSENTGGRIDRIVPDQIPSNTVMYLINAIFFKGNWTHQFDPDLTREAPFRRADGAQTMVPLMSHEAEVPLRTYFDTDVSVADIPYGGGAYSMTVLLPPSADGIEALTEDLSQALWADWIAELDSSDVRLYLPKFTLEYESTLNDALQAIGMASGFCGGGANFSNIHPSASLCIDEVKHKTFVDVNEEGTAAAAATSVNLVDSAPPTFRVDRPFLFAIRERFSGTILFMGRLMDPPA